MVRLALYKGKGQIGNAAIRLWTRSEYSHCEIVADGWCYSSSVMDKGVRRKLIDLEPLKWDLIELPWVDAQEVRDYFHLTDDDTYGWLGLISSQLLNLARTPKGSQFCSQWCANAVGMPGAPSYSPASLGKLAKYINTLI